MKRYELNSLALQLAPLWIIATSVSAEPASAITLHYYERPPFHYTDVKGIPSGLIVERAVKVFKKLK